ncbi:MAG: DUF488 domain-containing protein [Bauldia sp.]|nr:DUF488 domain-containing protein [Bauldia sp.]
MAGPILTIGHSNHPLARFVELVRGAGGKTVVDVRSIPVSQYAPHFNRGRLESGLPEVGLGYVFKGETLGGRPGDPSLYTGVMADYEKMAASPRFQEGVAAMLDEAGRSRVVLMCAERDPLNCHRCLLIGRHLAERGEAVGHILATGEIETHAAAEERLIELEKVGGLFGSKDEQLAEAYRRRAQKTAFAAPAPRSGHEGAI